MLTSKAIFFNEFPTRKKIWGTFTLFCEKNILCEKGDEITRFDGTVQCKCKYRSMRQIIIQYVCNYKIR